MRSLLFVPAHNERFILSALKTDADILLLDIEDSVQPIVNKQIARDNIIKYLEQEAFKGKCLFPRVNDRESGQLLKDVYQLALPGIAGFMYPKSKTGDDVYFFDKLLETIEYEKGIPVGTFKIIPLIETASAVIQVDAICKASNRVVAIAYGSEDFITDLEGIHDTDHQSLFVPRTMIAMAARANNVIPIDTVHVNVHDLDDLERNLKISKKLGFEGMLVLNPKELELVHRYFSPTDKEYEDAVAMLQAAEVATKEGKGVTIVKGKFIGPPMILHAKKVINRMSLINNR